MRWLAIFSSIFAAVNCCATSNTCTGSTRLRERTSTLTTWSQAVCSGPIAYLGCYQNTGVQDWPLGTSDGSGGMMWYYTGSEWKNSFTSYTGGSGTPITPQSCATQCYSNTIGDPSWQIYYFSGVDIDPSNGHTRCHCDDDFQDYADYGTGNAYNQWIDKYDTTHLNPSGKPYSPTCSVPCAGSSLLTCGSKTSIQIYLYRESPASISSQDGNTAYKISNPRWVDDFTYSSANNLNWEFTGCFQIGKSGTYSISDNVVTFGSSISYIDDNGNMHNGVTLSTVDQCRGHCIYNSEGIAGVYRTSSSGSFKCACGNYYNNYPGNKQLMDNDCQKYSCPGNSSEACGGVMKILIYTNIGLYTS